MTARVLPTGIHVFERGWLSSNNILFTDGENSLMVDSGYATHASQTLSLVEKALAGRPLDVLVNTHLHSDHCGGNSVLQSRYSGLQTYVPSSDAMAVSDWNTDALTYEVTGQLCPRFKQDGVLKPGTEIKFGLTVWQAHAASGHDPNSLVFFDPENKILISADALWENGFGVIFPELDGENAFSQVADTLDLIEALQPVLVIPGHGSVFQFSNEIMQIARQRLDFFVTHPNRHAVHAVKVLLKFKLMEMQRFPYEEFIHWALVTPYFERIRSRFFKESLLKPWIEKLCTDLIAANVARRDQLDILNI